MSADINSRIIRFFRECYESDNRGTNITNIFSRKVEHSFFVNTKRTAEFARKGSLSLSLTEAKIIPQLAKEFRREKKLIFACEQIIINRTNEQGKSVKYAAPIRYVDIEVSGKGEYSKIECDLSNLRWNTSLLREIIPGNINWDELDKNVGKLPFGRTFSEQFSQWLAPHFPEKQIITSEVDDLEGIKSLSRSRSKKNLFIVQSGLIVAIERSLVTRGIVHELEKLENTKQLSQSLQQMLSGGRRRTTRTTPPDFGKIPGILSVAQQKVLINASKKRLSQVIGPPGTGKSYTIANIAIDRFLNNEKVLIISQNEHAINVIQKQLNRKLGVSSSAVVRAGGPYYHKLLKKVVGGFLKSYSISWHKSSYSESRIYRDVNETNQDLKALKAEITGLEKEFLSRSEAAVDSGIHLDSHLNDASFWRFLRSYRIRSSVKRVKTGELLHESIDELYTLYDRRERLVGKFINGLYDSRLKDTLTDFNKRRVISKFHYALKARNSARQQSLFDKTDYSFVLDVLPIWLSSLEGLHRCLPLKKDLFDVVIIDEATQCDIASCLPAIQRAKRVVVVGDPNQLRHVSFLSRAKQDVLLKKQGLENFETPLNFREESMIDMINHNLSSSEDVVMLDEHYRSLPELIKFSNENYYDSRLRIMTERPLVTEGNPLSLIKVNGTRLNGKNAIEADKVIEYVRGIIERQREIPDEYKLSIGILSFFRDQAELLQEKILDLHMDDIAAHQIRGGTPYSFQGEERDIMLISCAVDNDVSSGTYQYLNRENMFNVAITRAKTAQVLFLSAAIENIPKNNQLSRYIRSFEVNRGQNLETFRSNDAYINDLVQELRKRKIRLVQNYTVAGVLMDLVAIYKGKCLAIDLIGFPGEYEDAFHLNRYKIFDRAGFSIFPISLEEWKYRREEILTRISEMLNNEESEEQEVITQKSLFEMWPLLLEFNPEKSKEVRLLELEFTQLGNSKVYAQLKRMVEAYHKFIQTLLTKLSKEEHTFMRYKDASDAVLTAAIENYNRILGLIQSLPSLSEEENHPLMKLVKEQRTHISNVLNRNDAIITQLEEMTLGWGRVSTNGTTTEIDYLQEQLKSLTDQIEKYNN